MKKSKRLIAAAGVLSVAVLAGCGGNASNSTEGTKSEQSASAESTKDELVFVNYRDIRDLNPICMQVKCMHRKCSTRP